jgi:hypothetical protein
MALSIAPSKHWLGNDGPWSAFNIQIGVSQELVQVLPASSASLTLAVLELGCNGRIDQSTCEDLRGAVLDPSDLATWSNITAANNEPFLNVTFPSEEFYFGEGIPSAVGVTSLNLEWYGSQSVNCWLCRRETLPWTPRPQRTTKSPGDARCCVQQPFTDAEECLCDFGAYMGIHCRCPVQDS